MNFCTLFDSYYLDKGLALYASLDKVCENFTLYIFCFDDRSYEILKELALPHMVALHQSAFEFPVVLFEQSGILLDLYAGCHRVYSRSLSGGELHVFGFRSVFLCKSRDSV